MKHRYKLGFESLWRCMNHECPSFRKLVKNGSFHPSPCPECGHSLYATRLDPDER